MTSVANRNRVMVDRLVDKLRAEQNISGADVARTGKLLRLVLEGLPRYRDQQKYVHIIVAWTYTLPEVVGLQKRCQGNHSELRKLAAACVVLRMRTREQEQGRVLVSTFT